MSDENEATGRMVRESGKLSALTMISRVLGLIRERTRGALMGTGALADAFSVAFIFPNLFRRLFAENSMTVAFIPTVRSYLSEGDREATEEFMSATLTVLTFLVCAVVALGIATAPFVVRAFYDTDPVETTVLLRIMFPFLALVSIAAFLQGILNAMGSFVPSGVGPILFNLCFIFVPMAIGGMTANPARAMAVGVVIGGLAQALCQLPAVLRLGARFRFIPLRRAFGNPGMRRIMMLLAPTILGMAAYEINTLVSSSMASRAGTGVATALQFSLRLQELILGVFVVSLGTVILPELSGLAEAGRWDGYRDRLARALEAIALITIPVAFFAIAERVDIVSVIYKTRQFGDDSVALTASAFLYHMMGLPFIGLQRILAPAFYARRNTKSPTWAGIASVVVNIVAVYALAPFMGGSGIALALSVASAVNAGILVVMMLRAGVAGMGKAFVSVGLYALRLVAFSVVAAVPVVLLREPFARLFGGFSSNIVRFGLPFAVSGVIFAFIGVGLLVVSRDRVGAFLVGSLRGRSKRRSN